VIVAVTTAVDGQPVARAPTDIDLANAETIGEELVAAVPHDATSLSLDLTDTRYLDSAGIAMLLMLQERLSRRRQKLRIVVPARSPVRRLLQVAGVDRTLDIRTSCED